MNEVTVSDHERDRGIHIVYAGDDRVASGIAVSARSLLRYHPDAEITVLQDGWSQSSVQRLRRVARDSNLTCIPVDSQSMPTATGLTRAAYLRLLIPEVVEGDDLALYLDADTLVRRPLLEELRRVGSSMLYSTGAVRDSETPFIATSVGLHSWRVDGLKPTAAYVNSGVLLIRLGEWRNNEIGRRTIEWKRTHPSALHDQDALNAVLNGEVLLLPQKYNATAHMMRPTSQIYAYEPTDEVDEARSDPVVVHFTGAIKPWHRNSEAPFLEEWRDVASGMGRVRFDHSFSVRRRVERRLIRLIDSSARPAT